MPPIQLSTLVLPAPLGPMSANSSAASTAKETPSRTVRPPKRKPRPSTWSSAIPSPATAILLDVAIAAPRAAQRQAQIELLDVRVAAQALAVAVEHDPAVLHAVAIAGETERHGGALLDDGDRQPQVLADLQQTPAEVGDDGRRQAEGELVDQQQLRPGDECGRQRQHLPLA